MPFPGSRQSNESAVAKRGAGGRRSTRDPALKEPAPAGLGEAPSCGRL